MAAAISDTRQVLSSGGSAAAAGYEPMPPPPPGRPDPEGYVVMENLLKESKEKSRKKAFRALAAGISSGFAAAGFTVEKVEGPDL